LKFFVPGVDHPDEAERFYAILKAVASARGGAVSDRRIASISFSRGRQDHSATVGGDDTSTGLPCVAIFESRRGGIYSVYTEGPLSRSGHLVTAPYHVESFDAEDG
jgi:hypothetical protein